MSTMETSQQKQEQFQGYPAYPKVSPELASAHPPGSIPAYETGRWGTYTMAPPSNPQAHPQNQQAATWEPMAYGNVETEGELGSNESEKKECKQASAPSPVGYVYPASTPFQGNAYVTIAPVSKYSDKGFMDILSDYLTKWRKKFEEVSKTAEEMIGNIWQHMKTGPSVADTAWGRLSQGAKLLTEGGSENVFKNTFETLPGENLQKSYACYLSTSSGPVAGTLYISNEKLAFCSDRPLSYCPSLGQTAWSYYKIVVPLDRLQIVNPLVNPNSQAEKYIQIVTVDNHEFWFMGFVSYDKAVKNLQKASKLCG